MREEADEPERHGDVVVEEVLPRPEVGDREDVEQRLDAAALLAAVRVQHDLLEVVDATAVVVGRRTRAAADDLLLGVVAGVRAVLHVLEGVLGLDLHPSFVVDAHGIRHFNGLTYNSHDIGIDGRP